MWHYKDGRVFCLKTDLRPTQKPGPFLAPSLSGSSSLPALGGVLASRIWPHDSHLSSVIHHPSSVSPRELQARSENWGNQYSCSLVLLAYAALDSSWLGTSSRSPAPKLEWETGISVGLSKLRALSEGVGLSTQAPIGCDSTHLLHNQLLMRPLQLGSPSRVSWLPSRLHREWRTQGKMSLFPRAWPVRGSRLWLPVVRGPEHSQARGCHLPVETREPWDCFASQRTEWGASQVKGLHTRQTAPIVA